MTAKLALLAVLCLASPSEAAFRSTDDLRYWAPTFLHAKPSGRLSGLLELNPRARGDFGRLDQLIVRPWLGWKLSAPLTAHAGYAWVRSDTGRVAHEHRAWEQATLEGKAVGSTLTARARLEQRWLERVDGISLRGRLLARWERPLGGGPWYAAASNEAFVHLNSVARGPSRGFDQNRGYLGFGRKGGAKRRAELGYQHWWTRRPSAPDTVLHVVVLTTHWSPN